MPGFDKVTIGGFSDGGLTLDKKPLMLADQAFSKLENAYAWRFRIKKREGIVGMGRLQRNIPSISFFQTTPLAPPSTYTVNILTITGYISAADNANPGQITTFLPHNLVTGDQVVISNVVGATGYNNVTFTVTVVDATNFTIGQDAAGFGAYVSGGIFVSNRSLTTVEPNATIKPGSVVYTILIMTPRVFTDDGNGNLVASSSPLTNFGTINYSTGDITITTTAFALRDTLLQYSYYPGLPVMGICKQDIAAEGIDNTIFFDTRYAYQFVAGAFQELLSATPTVWTGNETQFFWYCNYQGVDPSVRLFFATNYNLNDPIRYYDNTTWNDLTPIIADNPPSASQFVLFQALIVIPYYGRLLALNTWEGPSAGGTGTASNFYARCRFSQIGDPTAADAWRSDIFGRGGFLDAPTNESIISAAFFRNTLVVFFEYSTWQLRYIGEYGLPFIFERINSDFGSSCTYGSVIFDEGVYAISNRGIIKAAPGELRRVDDNIPDLTFGFKVTDSAPNFVHGGRDFEKSLVYWNYLDTTGDESDTQNFPNTTLLYNYQNNTWAQFRDTITCFGPVQFQFGITWESTTTFWENENVLWETPDDQNDVLYVGAGNQQGYVFIYEDQEAQTPIPSITNYAPSLYIYAINNVAKPAQFTIPDHNLLNGEIIYVTSAVWSGTDPGINNSIYNVSVIDKDTITLGKWNGTNYVALNISSSPTYLGAGEAALFPVMNIVGKDFNPYQAHGKQFKVSYIDFQMDSDNSIPAISALTVKLFVNSALNDQANVAGFQELLVNSALNSNFITNARRSNPCRITCINHSLPTGTQIYIANVVGMTQLNNVIYTITVDDADHFFLDGIDATGFTAYKSGGIFNTVPKAGTPYQLASQYAWYRFYSNQFGQYLRVGITYDDNLMNQIATHQSSMELNAINFFFRPGGRLPN